MNILTDILVKNFYARHWRTYNGLCDLISSPLALNVGIGKSQENYITENRQK